MRFCPTAGGRVVAVSQRQSLKSRRWGSLPLHDKRRSYCTPGKCTRGERGTCIGSLTSPEPAQVVGARSLAGAAAYLSPASRFRLLQRLPSISPGAQLRN
jgi:hypothetical protein